MASGFGKIVVGTYVEIKRSDGKFYHDYSFPSLCVSCLKSFVAVEYSNRCCWLQSATFTLAAR